VTADPAIREIDRVFQATGYKKVVPDAAKPSLKVNDLKLELANEQISQYQRLVGVTSMTLIRSYTASPGFARLPDTLKTELTPSATPAPLPRSCSSKTCPRASIPGSSRRSSGGV
jgi:hypothetical protein